MQSWVLVLLLEDELNEWFVGVQMSTTEWTDRNKVIGTVWHLYARPIPATMEGYTYFLSLFFNSQHSASTAHMSARIKRESWRVAVHVQ